MSTTYIFKKDDTEEIVHTITGEFTEDQLRTIFFNLQKSLGEALCFERHENNQCGSDI